MKKEKSKKGNKKIKIIAIVLALIILVLGVGVTFVAVKFKKIKEAPVPTVPEDTMVYDFDNEEDDDHEFEKMFEGTADSFKASLKDWVTNGGELMYSKDVTNILCIGVDTRNKNTISGLTDSMILLSINKALGTITMTSIMRDCYSYLVSPDGDESYNKINSAFPFYGVDNLITTIQNHFKIKIDGYAMINFNFFKSVIDKLGGVNVRVQQYEADYINSLYKFGIKAGKSVTLNGDEALAFCRSRHCDSDGEISRTRRQRQVMISLLHKTASIKPSEISDYISYFLPLIETSYSEKELVSLATKAVIGGWSNFKVTQLTMPDEESRYGYSGSSWFWAVDYPLAAQTLQNQIYGNSNIILQENRVTAIDLLLGKGE